MKNSIKIALALITVTAAAWAASVVQQVPTSVNTQNENYVVVSGSMNVTGSSITVTNFPAVQAVSGTVDVTGSTVTISNFSVQTTTHVSVDNFPAVQAISGTVTVANSSFSVTGSTVSVNGTVGVSNSRLLQVAVSSVTTVSVGPSAAVTLKAANASRIMLVIFNENGTLYVKAGADASSSDYTWRLSASTELDIDWYTGEITARKGAGTSSVQVSEF